MPEELEILPVEGWGGVVINVWGVINEKHIWP